MRHIERSPELGQVLLNLFGSLPVTFCGRGDPECAQQLRGRPPRVAGLAEHGMKALASQMMKNEIDDAPGVKSLFVHALVMGCHAPEKTPFGEIRRSQLERS